jgi:hypothetical protein
MAASNVDVVMPAIKQIWFQRLEAGGWKTLEARGWRLAWSQSTFLS